MIIQRYFILLIGLATTFCMLGGCAYNRFEGDMDSGSAVDVMPNYAIGDMKALLGNSSVPLVVNRDIVVGGVVVANDKSGNFYRTFILEDASGAVEVMCGSYDVSNSFAMGQRVVIEAKGLAVASYNGVMQIGLHVPHLGRPDYFNHKPVIRRYVFVTNYERTRVVPTSAAIADLTTDMCGRLVEIGGLRLDCSTQPDVVWQWAENEEFSTSTFRFFKDTLGNRIAVATSKYADFASAEIPHGELKLTGILMYGKTTGGEALYFLKLRTLEDVAEK